MRTLGWLEAGPRAAERLETKKAGALFAAHAEIKRGNDRQAFLYKNCSIQRGGVPGKGTPKVCAQHTDTTLKRTRMKVKCCWNEAHVSTMTEDRANPRCGGQPRKGGQSLAGWGIQRIAAVWKKDLKRVENVLSGESASLAGRKKPRTWRGFFRVETPWPWWQKRGLKCGSSVTYSAAGGT